MTLQQKIYNKITAPETEKQEKSVLKLVKSDIQREKNKNVPDNVVLRIIKSHISGALECIKFLTIEDVEKYNDCILCINVLEKYLPKMVSDDAIIEYINDNIDLSQYKNVMQAMKPIMTHFGSTANGNTVKSILLKLNT